jgi:hypothetical protein
VRRTTTIAILAATCAALAIAPQMAMGKTPKFTGPVNQPFVPSNTGFPRDVPSIELKVVFRGKTPSVIPDGVVRVKGIYGPCLESNGCKPLCLDFNGVCDPPQCFGSHHDGITDTTHNTVNHAFKIKKNRRFSGTYRNPELDTPEEVAGNFMILTGKVTKKSVTGTVHAHFYRAAGVDSAGNPRPAETCDTGVLTYKATK